MAPKRTGWLLLATCLLASCQAAAPVSRGPVTDLASSQHSAYLSLENRLDTFHVTGEVKTSEGILLPERITIEIRSEVCVESRQPGARFWSLDYDTCFTYASIDTVDEEGEYSVSVPCIDADQTYEARHAFGDLRLVQKGPVSFLAQSDAGWRHQETFSSSRIQRRDLILTLEPETFYVIGDEAVLRERSELDSPEIRKYPFGSGVGVIRFQGGWAQCLMDGRIGWIEMRSLGTESEMKEIAPVKLKQSVEPITDNG